MISSREKRNSDKNEDSGLELSCPFEKAWWYIGRSTRLDSGKWNCLSVLAPPGCATADYT